MKISSLLFIGLALPLVALPSDAALSKDMLSKVTIDQNIGQKIPLQLTFHDETGQRVALKQYFGKRAVILSLVYYRCPSLCPQTMSRLAEGLRKLSFRAGSQYNVLMVSIDPRETPRLAAAEKEKFVKKFARVDAIAGSAFLTGNSQNVHKLAQAAGFHYVYDWEYGQYAHAAGLIIVTPDGTIARYLYGLNYSPRDLRLALLESNAGTLHSTADRFLLFCYHYDPVAGRYNLLVQRLLGMTALVAVLILAAWLVVMIRRERRDNPLPPMWGKVRLGGHPKG